METWNVCCLTKGLVGVCPVRATGAAQSASKGSAPNECDLEGAPRRVNPVPGGGAGPTATEPELIIGGLEGLGGTRGGTPADAG